MLGNPTLPRLAAVVFCLLLNACADNTPPTEAIWLADDTDYIKDLAITADGTQLAITESGPELRNSDGLRLADPDLDSLTPQLVVGNDNEFLAFGVDDQTVWLARLTNTGSLSYLQQIYTASDMQSSLMLTQFDNETVVHWVDAGSPAWYSIPLASSFHYPLANAEHRYSFGPGYRFYYVDNSSQQLVTVDMSTLAETGRSPVDSDFLGTGKLAVNERYAVATVATELHEGTDLTLQNRTDGSVLKVASDGGFGKHFQGLLGQDQAGTIYYYYYAEFAYQEFGKGMHIRAISTTEPLAWEQQVRGGPPLAERVYYKSLSSGIQLMYVDQTNPYSWEYVESHNRTRFVQLNGAGSVQDQFHMTAHILGKATAPSAWPIERLLQEGYLGEAFATNTAGQVMIYGRTGPGLYSVPGNTPFAARMR